MIPRRKVIHKKTDLTNSNQIGRWLASRVLQIGDLSKAPLIHIPWLEHALRTLPVKLDDKKMRTKLEEIIEELDGFTKISIEQFISNKDAIFQETDCYVSEIMKPEKILDLIENNNIIWTHNVFRFIQKLNHKYLDVDVLANVELLRSEENFYHPSKVKSIIFTILDEYETNILTPYYNDIVSYTSTTEHFKDVEMKKMRRYLALINQYIKGYILNKLTATIKKFIKIFTDPDLTPYLELSVHYNNGSMEIKPSLKRIKQLYKSVLKKISSLCSTWEPLGTMLGKSTERQLTIKHQDDFLFVQQTIMLANVEQLLSPITKKFQLQESELSEIANTFFNDKAMGRNEDNPNKDSKFWIMWQERIEAMNDVDFVGIFRLDQQPMKTTLLALVKLQTTQAFCDLIYQHLDLNLKMRKETFSVKDRCRKIPSCSEELVAVAKYMQTCSTQWIQGLRLRTMFLLKLTTELMDAVELTSDHTNLVCGTISLLNSIKSSFREFKQVQLEKLTRLAFRTALDGYLF